MTLESEAITHILTIKIASILFRRQGLEKYPNVPNRKMPQTIKETSKNKEKRLRLWGYPMINNDNPLSRRMPKECNQN